MFGIDFIRKLKPCKWRYTGNLDDGVEHFGFIAQDVDDLASHERYGFVVLGENGYFGLRMTEFIGPMVKAMQEMDAKIIELENKLEMFHGRKHEVTTNGHMGINQVGHYDSLGSRHDLETHMGDL